MNLLYYYWISTVQGLNTRKIYKILDYFGNIRDAWRGSFADFSDIQGISAELANRIIFSRDESKLLKEINNIKEMGIDIISKDSETYPENLKNIYHPPIILYIKGVLQKCSVNLGVVGSRNCSSFGKVITRNIVRQLCEYNIGIISGLARGIDTEAHLGALEGNGYTCAVLGCGCDVVYPPENKKIMTQIQMNGAVVSEYSPGTPPLSYNFPERNRIISGLSDGLLVVEAGEKSGALITVDFAIDQGKDVFAVPGSILSSTCKGTNKLIRDGAKIVTDVFDILEELKIDFTIKNNTDANHINEVESIMLDEISNSPVHVDDLLQKLKFKISEFNSVLTSLELKGIVKVLPGKYVVRTF